MMATIDLQSGVRLSYRQTADAAPGGTRPALIVHRAGGSSRDWKPVLEVCGPTRRLVAFDLPGHGESPGPALSTIKEMADIVALFAESLGLDRPLLVGHSMGGAVALQAALDHPALPSALLLISSGATLRVAQMVIETVRDHFDALPQLMGEMAFSRETPRPLVAESLATLFGAPRDVVLTDLQACNGWSVEPRLADLRLPVTALVGKDDMLTPPSLARRLKDRLPTAKVTVLPCVGHMAPTEASDLVGGVLIQSTGDL